MPSCPCMEHTPMCLSPLAPPRVHGPASARSYYNPVSNTIDGDLLEQFPLLSYAKQKQARGGRGHNVKQKQGHMEGGRSRTEFAEFLTRQAKGEAWQAVPALAKHIHVAHEGLGPRLHAWYDAEVASELERTPAEILKKLEDLRNRIL